MRRLKILLIVVVTIIITGCGGGGSSSFENEIVNITIKCTTISPSIPTDTDILTYHELFSGDKIIQDETGTIVQLYTPLDKNSRVCLETGSAHIVRN